MQKFISFLSVLKASLFNVIERSLVFILWKRNQQRMFMRAFAGQRLSLASHSSKPGEITQRRISKSMVLLIKLNSNLQQKENLILEHFHGKINPYNRQKIFAFFFFFSFLFAIQEWFHTFSPSPCPFVPAAKCTHKHLLLKRLIKHMIPFPFS